MLVREVMSSPAVTVDAAQSATTVIRLLAGFRITSLPVVDENERLVGIIGEADVVADAAVLGEPRTTGWGTPARVSVEDRMVRRVVSVDADAEVIDAVTLMSRATLKSLPVVLNGRVVGILSRSDVVRAAAAQRDRPLNGGAKDAVNTHSRRTGS
jgi:CBS domain-containing protein